MLVLGVLTATAAAFVISALYYGTMPAASPELAPERPLGAQMVVELVRNLAVAGLVAGLVAAANWSGLGAGVLLGLSLGVLPVVLLAGSVFHEGVPTPRAALHTGDWLLKLVAIGAIVGLFA